MAPEPPHINTDPAPLHPNINYSPCQDPLAGAEDPQLGIDWSKPGPMDGLHIWSSWKQTLPDNNRFSLLGFQVLILGILQFLCHHWCRSALMLLCLVLLVLAPYYTRHYHITHRWARGVRRLFFITLTYPGNPHPPQFNPRIFPLMAIAILSVVLLFWP